MREIPDWLDKHRINEAKFCEAFLKTHPMVSVNHAFFTKEGRITDEDIFRKAIYDEIKDHITSGATHRVNNLLEVLRMECCREKEGIFLWALDGLHRLIANDYEFTLSQKSQANLEEAVSDGNNVIDFLASTGYIQFKADSEAYSRDLYAAYRNWCEDNALHSLGLKSFCSYLKQNERRYNLEYTNKISIGNGKQVRGFVGIEVIK